MKKRAALFKHLKNKSGSAIVFAVLILVVVSIFISIVFTLFSSNLKQAKYQEHYIEAYYLAYSGTQMAFTSLIADENELFNDIKNDTVESLSENDIVFENGIIDILVTKSNDANYDGWIKITSTGTLNSYNISRTRTMYIDPSNQKNVVWKEN